MRTKYWILLLVLLLVFCLGLSISLLLPDTDATTAEIISDGQVVRIVPLNAEAEFIISAPNGGENTITVKDGKIGVTAASCPDHYCMDRGMCSNGVQIVCLPNRLIIRFAGEPTVDSVSG